jgi:TonB-linked SusC/RagA family outer membrane protein
VIVGAAERRLKMDLLYNGGDYTAIAGGQLSPFLTDSLNPAFNNNTDWQGLFLRSARVTNVDAGIAAADSKFAYRLSFNHYTEQGVMKGYDFKRAQPHLYLSANPGRGLNVTANLFIGMIRQAHGSGDGNRYPFSTWSFPSSFWKLTPDLISAYTGGFASQMDDDRSTSLNANIRLTDTLAKGLLLTSSFSSNNDFNNRDWFYSKLVNPNGTNDVLSFNYKTSRWEVENYLTYNTSIAEDHHLSAVLGQGAENQKNGYTNSEADGVNVGHVVTISNVPPGTNLFTTSYREERSRLSWFGRLAYDFKGRYLFSGSYRRDASSRYSSDNRWANFYSASAGWIVSDEPFFQGIKNVVSFFKLRGSYGVTGSDPSNYYAQYQKLVANAAYNGSSLSGGANQGLHVLGWDIPGFGMSTYNGTTALVPDYASAAAKNASWEKYPQFNIGVDLSFLKDRISLTADVYVRDSKNLFFYNVKPQVTSGYNYFTGNMVDLRNRGVEFTLNTNNLSPTSKFKWSTNFNIALNDNFVTKLPNGNRDFVFGDPWLQQTLTIGQPVFTYSVWETNGVFSTNAEVPVDPLTGKRLTMFGGNVYSAGDPKRVDQNGDYNIDYLDKISYGNPNPRVTGGIVNQFSYKGFSLQVLCSFITGRKIWNGYLSDKFNGSSYNAYGVWGTQSGPASNLNGLSFWQKPGDVAQYPGMIGNNVDKWHISNSTFIEDGSFFKLRQVMAGYTLPQAITKKLKLKNIRIYGMADNLIILSRATIPDPEAVSPTGWSSGSDYPVPKKYTFGIEVQL